MKVNEEENNLKKNVKGSVKVTVMMIVILLMSTNIVYATNEVYVFDSADRAKEYIVEEMLEFKDSIRLDLRDREWLDKVTESQARELFISALELDNYARFIYTGAGMSQSRNANTGGVSIRVNPRYLITQEQHNKAMEKIDIVIERIIRDNMTDIEKVRAINNYIVDNTSYNSDTKNHPGSVYTILFEREGVCHGYAVTTYLMLNYVGIDNILVSGLARNENHLWNMVNIGGEWFHLDVTWNDPIGNRIPADRRYKYFLKDQEFMRETHQWEYEKYPTANSRGYSHLINIRTDRDTEIDREKYLIDNGNGKHREVNQEDARIRRMEERRKNRGENKLVVRDNSYSEWARDEIDDALENRIVTQRILEDFRKDITREEFAELAMNLYYQLGGKEVIPTNKNAFGDTENFVIMQANSLGIVDGIGNGIFNPNGNVTRQQMAAMIERLIRALELNPIVTMEYRYFSDEDEISEYAKNSIQLMNKLGVINGVGNQRINPRGNASRQQSIAMMVRLYEQFSK